MKRSLCVLLVEDDAALGLTARHALDHLGHRAVLATSASTLYARLSNPHDFHLVLLDLQLDDQRSEPVILRLRTERIAVPVIIILSAQPLHEIARAVRAIGAAGYLQKPATMEQIHQALELVAV
jgi:DNA-binding NtrC family response regulator